MRVGLNLPVLRSVEFRQFSLYSNRPSQRIEIRDGAFCLAGANGLGKSTFLNAVGFALTGVVPNPNDRFDSVDEHYRHNLDYAAHYFRGRIDDVDHDVAEIAIVFDVGSRRYSLTRGLFERESLRELLVVDRDHDDEVDVDVGSDEKRDAWFRSSLASDIGIGTFQQFVFLQHFVLTFDERRRLLFWDNDLMERALYIAFGIATEDASRADQLRRLSERADSQRRNAQYQATEARKRLKALQARTAEDDAEGAASGADYEKLIEEAGVAGEKAQIAQLALDDAELELTRLRSDEMSLRTDYEREFASRFEELADPRLNPSVVSATESCKCLVCGTNDPAVGKNVQDRLESGHCPLCDAAIEFGDENEISAALGRVTAITAGMELLQKTIRAKAGVIEGLAEEASLAFRGALDARNRTRAFEEEHQLSTEVIEALRSGASSAESQLQAEIDGALARKEEWRVKRDTYRKELRELQAQLTVRYRDAETEFVPKFKDLAQDFLGLQLDLQLDVRKSTEVELVLTVEGTRRRAHDQLSESQRYFVDIALRMALAQHMAGRDGASTLFIDTPEGSLDLAYESRAGRMLAEFVGRGHNVLMTANLNASQLLRQLASRCGHEKMELVRMIDWRELSEVQSDAEELFEDAYSRIENALDDHVDSRT